MNRREFAKVLALVTGSILAGVSLQEHVETSLLEPENDIQFVCDVSGCDEVATHFCELLCNTTQMGDTWEQWGPSGVVQCRCDMHVRS